MSGPIYNEDRQKKEVYWCVDGSDDEKYDPSKSGKGVWEPNAEDILKLFERIEKDKVLELKWNCPGRKPPPSEADNDGKDAEMDEKDEETNAEEDEKKVEQPTEFDFDDDEFGDVSNPITPRRTPGSKTPKSQKKVATMDKVLKNIMIERKQAALQKEARKLAKSPRTPLSTPRTKIGTPPMTSNSGQGQRLTPLRPPVMSDTLPIRNLALSSATENKSDLSSETKDMQTGSTVTESADRSEQKHADNKGS